MLTITSYFGFLLVPLTITSALFIGLSKYYKNETDLSSSFELGKGSLPSSGAR